LRAPAAETAKQSMMAELKERAERAAPAICQAGHSGLVWGEGSLSALIAIVGEAPGDKEEKLGRPFVGPAGRLLDRELERAGLKREQTWITNVVKCRPTRETRAGTINRPPAVKEVHDWLGFLMEELTIISPRVIVCAGAVAASALIHKSFALTKDRGRWFEGPLGTRAIATFHPAYLLRQVGDAWDSSMAAFRSDLRQAAEVARPLQGAEPDAAV